ncbi:MAG: hypothetical protein ACOC9B_06530 [Chloroflexota bacterium]
MPRALTQELLDDVPGQIESQFGTHVDVEFLSVEMDQRYIVAHYRATYTDGQPGVGMVFDADGMVAGQFFE